MKTIVVASQKGGSGKTAIVAHLAVAAEQAGNRVVLVDTDPQGTLSTWWNVRQSESPKLAPVDVRALPKKLDALARAGFAYCIIDTPPALSEQNRQVLASADLVLIPTRPSPADLWALGATLDLVKAAGVPYVFVITQAKRTARITGQVITALSQHGHVLPAVVHDRVDYAASITDGRTAPEIHPAGPAAAEIAALWDSVRKRLTTTRRRLNA